MSRTITVELTQAQAWATVQALDATALAGDMQDALSVYGNASTVAAAFRAHEILTTALRKCD